MKMKWYIGIDGGGTKTEFLLRRENGTVLGRIRKGSADYREIGLDGVGEMVCRGIQELLAEYGKQPEDICCACMGMPNFSEIPENDAYIKKWLEKHWTKFPIYLVNDVLVGWAGALALKPGIHLVAGTGAIAIGVKNPHQYIRCGGWHNRFSDEGSGYWLGIETMRLFTKEADGRRAKGALYELIKAEFEITEDTEDMKVVDIWEKEYLPYRDRTASLQLILKKAAEQGDLAAKELYWEAGKELAEMVRSLYSRMPSLSSPVLVSKSGGVFRATELLWESLKEYTGDLSICWQEPAYEPAEGAAILAQEFWKERTE